MATRIKSAPRKPSRKSRPASPRATPARVLYLYGVGSKRVGLKQLVAGIDGEAAVESVVCAGLVCWVSRVDRHDYADALASNMENLDWLANASVRHQRAVSALAAVGDVVPTRFGSVFLTENSLASDVAARRTKLLAALKRIAGCEEWGIKVFAEPPAASVAAVAASGRDYLARKSAQLGQQRAKPQPPPQLAEFAKSLARLAREVVTMKVGPGQPNLVWQAAVLMRRADVARLHAAVESFARSVEHARVETSGPWPPYSFAG